MQWYVLQAYSGSEADVKRVLEARIANSSHKDKFGEILVPSEEIIEIRSDGKKRKSERKFFPGYVLVQMDMDEEIWHFVKSIPKVLGFIGGTSDKPAALSEKEAQRLIQQLQTNADKPKPKVLFEPGELIRVKEGPFADFNGTVEEVNYEKNKLRVSVLIFGRATPVDLDFSQVEKT